MKLLRKVFKKILKILVSELGIGPFLQSRSSITVLTYHGITDAKSDINDFCFVGEDEFDKQMKYLSQNFDVKSAEDAYLNSYNNEKPVAVVTFDDGFFNNFSHAFPILKKYGVPATIFLSTNFIDSNDTIWFCKIIQVIESSQESEISWRGSLLPIKSGPDKRLASSIIQTDLKRLHPASIEEELITLFDSLNINMDFNDTPYGMLTEKSVIEMQESKLITFGAHTHNHAILTKLSKDESKNEIHESLRQVQILTGKKCTMFAYPNGGVGDYSNNHKQILQNSSVSLTFSMKDGLSSQQDDYSEIKRLFISSHINMKQFSAQVHGY
jgi:peptidoglycan/xylan/chitin deacetylase (PgdA/CDA1 family)